MPNIPELDDPNVTDEMLEKNTEVIGQLENVIMSWGVHIEKVNGILFKSRLISDILIEIKERKYYNWHVVTGSGIVPNESATG